MHPASELLSDGSNLTFEQPGIQAKIIQKFRRKNKQCEQERFHTVVGNTCKVMLRSSSQYSPDQIEINFLTHTNFTSHAKFEHDTV
jgi:hypothetical protein